MFSFLISDAHAQAAAGQPPAFASFMPFVIIFVIFYFLMIRPQKKKMDQEQKFLQALQKGDEVYTKSGVLGRIEGLTDKIVTLQVSDGVKIKLLRSSIAGAAEKLFAVETGNKKLAKNKA